MRAYKAIFRSRISVLFQYRAAALAGMATQAFWAFVNVMILGAFYSQSDAVQPITFLQATTFVWLSQSLIQLIPWNLDKEIEAQIRSGQVATELVRPFDLYWYWYVRSVAMRCVPTLLRSIPLFVIAFLFGELPPPVSWEAFFGFFASCVNALFLSASITTLIIISLFWTLAGEGVERLMPHVAVLLCGLVAPLPLFPDWFQPFLSWQPYRGIIDIPTRIYMGMIQGDEIIFYLGFQLVWTGLLILFGRILLSKAMRCFVVQGG